MAKLSKILIDLSHNIKDSVGKGNDPRKFLNFTQFQIIKYLLEHQDEKVCQKDLEIETHLKKASITDTIDNLEDKGFVKRVQSTSDKRKNYVVITQKVEDFKKQFESNIDEVEKEMIKGISKEELETFLKVVDKINKNLRKEK